MQRLFTKLKVAYPVVLLLACVIIFSSVSISYAIGLSKREAVWKNYETGISASAQDTYPYDRLDDGANALDPSKISKVGFDVMYGSQHGLVLFLGEVPYEETHKDDGDPASGWSGYNSYYEGTSLSDTNYWGNTGVESGNDVDVTQLEAVNSESNIVSLRLYASSITLGQLGFWFSNIFYVIQLFFAGLGTKLIWLLIIAKNIDMLAILDALGLETLSQTITRAFIGDPETGSLSVFAGFCILMFMVSVAAMVFNYIRAGRKETGLKDLLIPVIFGIIITGVCLAGRITDLGSTLANLTNEVVYAIAGAMTDDSTTEGGGVFITDVDDELYENQIIQIQEMSLLNKCFVDMQICTQFNVMQISDLDLSKFGTTNTDTLLSNNTIGQNDSTITSLANLTSASTTAAEAAGSSTVDFAQDFGNNIGYYFWYANSGASYKTHYNQTIPETSPVAPERKLSNFMTWMQETYNNNSSNAEVKSLILTMTKGLASPSTIVGALRMFLFTGIMIVLFLCLWRYTKDILLAKFQMLVALLGMAIAGPLMFTGKKKLVNTGRDLMALILISFIQITVHSLMFDAIIYGTSIVINPDLWRLIITFFLLLLLFKFNKAINERIKNFTQSLEQSMMSSGSMVRDIKRKADTALSKKPHEFLAAKSREYDAANPDQVGGLKSKLLRMAADSTADSSQTKGFGKITMESMKDRKNAKNKSAEERLRDAENAVDNTMDKIDNADKQIHNKLDESRNELEKDQTMWSQKAQQASANRRMYEKQFEAMAKDLTEAQESNNIEEMTKIQAKISELNGKIAEQEHIVNEELTKQTISNAKLSDKQKESLAKFLENGTDMTTAIRSVAQEGYAETLKDNLEKLNKEAATQADKKLDGTRIGAPKVVNEKAVAAQNASSLMLKELEAGVSVDKLSDSKDIMEAVTKATVTQNNFDRQNNSAHAAVTGLKDKAADAAADVRADIAEATKDNNAFVRGVANAGGKLTGAAMNAAGGVASTVGGVGTGIAAQVTETAKYVAGVGAADISIQNAQNAASAIDAAVASKLANQNGSDINIADAAKRASDSYQKQKHEKAKKQQQVTNNPAAPTSTFDAQMKAADVATQKEASKLLTDKEKKEEYMKQEKEEIRDKGNPFKPTQHQTGYDMTQEQLQRDAQKRANDKWREIE